MIKFKFNIGVRSVLSAHSNKNVVCLGGEFSSGEAADSGDSGTSEKIGQTKRRIVQEDNANMSVPKAPILRTQSNPIWKLGFRALNCRIQLRVIPMRKFGNSTCQEDQQNQEMVEMEKSPFQFGFKFLEFQC